MVRNYCMKAYEMLIVHFFCHAESRDKILSFLPSPL